MNAIEGSQNAGDRPEPPAKRRGWNARRAARLAAVQALYQLDLVPGPVEAVIEEFVQHRLGGGDGESPTAAADRTMFAELVRGVAARQADLDAMIGANLAPGWTLGRLDRVLRAALRAGTFELLARPDIPARVAINEYVELAHSFFSGKEPGFVNGVLDRLAQQLRPDEVERRNAPPPRPE